MKNLNLLLVLFFSACIVHAQFDKNFSKSKFNQVSDKPYLNSDKSIPIKGSFKIPKQLISNASTLDKSDSKKIGTKSINSQKNNNSSKDWSLIMEEGFEGVFPNDLWVSYANSGYSDAYWDDSDCRAFTDDWSGYCAEDGSQGVDCGDEYPDNMRAWMIYGPFSLSDASDAYLSFYWWLNSEEDYDKFWVAASIDGSNYSGYYWSGNFSQWEPNTFDLTDVGTLGNLCGEEEVWIAFFFESDVSVTYTEGAYVDDIELWKNSSSQGPDIDVFPLTITIYQTDNKVVKNTPSYTMIENPASQDSDNNPSNIEHPLGSIIPDSVIQYWKENNPPEYSSDKSITSIDWSINDSPVKDQEDCGSCWAFAVTAFIENLGNQTDLSEQVVVSCSGGGDCDGGYFLPALEFFQSTGVPHESCYPYTATNGNCNNMCSNPTFIEKISTVSSTLWGMATVNNLIAQLQTGPLVVRMLVPIGNTFSGNPGYQGGIYDYIGGTIPETQGHVVLLVGYDDVQQYFKAKNSWGSGWGENGYFRIAYNDVTDDVQIGSYAINGSGVYTQYSNENSFTISNVGSGNLSINTLTDNKPWLSTSGYPSTPFNITSGNSQEVIANINWSQVGGTTQTGTIAITSNDPDEPTVNVQVTAVPIITNYLDLTNCPTNNVPSNTGNFPLQVSSNVSWTVSDDSGWVTCNPTSGSNNGTITVSYQQNTLSTDRTCTITITGSGLTETCTFTQEGEVITYLDFSGCPTANVPSNTGNFPLQVLSNISWTVSDNAGWVSCEPTSGSNNEIITVTFQANSNQLTRSCTVTVTGDGLTAICGFTQDGIEVLYLNLISCPTVIQPAIGGSFNLQVESNISWDVTDNASWVSCTPISGINNGIITVNFDPTSLNNSRTCIITIAGDGESATCTFTQEGIVGVFHYLTNKDFIIYPNPTSNKVFIELNNKNNRVLSIEIYDATGNNLNSIEPITKNDKLYEIDLKEVSYGIYLINVLTDQGLFTEKIVVKR